MAQIQQTIGFSKCYNSLNAINQEFQMILNQAQAEAVYSAVCAMNNVSAMKGVEVRFVGTEGKEDADYARFGFKEEVDGEVLVYVGAGLLGRERETYRDQAAFAAAYGLQ